jgi:hypothetical protein
MANQVLLQELQTLAEAEAVEDLTLTKVPMVALVVLEQMDQVVEAEVPLHQAVALVTVVLVVLEVLIVFTLAVQVAQAEVQIYPSLVSVEVEQES